MELHELLPALVAVIVLIVTFKMLYLSCAEPLKYIRQPWAWPFLKHYPYFWNADQLDVYANFAKDYKNDGLFRVNDLTLPEQVVLLDPEYPKYVLSNPKIFARSDELKNAFPFFTHGLLHAKGDSHKCQKRILNRGFTPERLSTYIPLYIKHADVLTEKWMEEVSPNSKNMQVLDPFQQLSFNVISEAICNYGQENGEFTDACKAVLDLAMSGSTVNLFLSIFPFLKNLSFGPGAGRRKAIEKADRIMLEIMAKRKHEIENNLLTTDQENDLLSCLYKAHTEDPLAMPENVIHDNIFVFFLGGYETTSTALMWVVYVLGIYPEIQKKAREEAKSVLKENDKITLTDINELKYLTNVIRETLRVYNASIRVGRVATQDCKIGEFTIPKGQMTKTVFNLFHLNKELFPEPEEFRPERFEDEANIKPGSWLAFGYGPYSCIGKQFAMNEIKVIIAKLLTKFKFTVDADNRCFKRNITLAVHVTPPVTVRIKKLETDVLN